MVVVTVAVMTKSRVDMVLVIGVLGMDNRHGHATLLALHGRVEMVFDCIIRAAGHMLGHLGPLGSELIVEFQDTHVFFMSEGGFVDCAWIHVRWRRI